MRAFMSFIFVVLGFVATFWGGFCLLGGPDGRILSRDSFVYAGVFLLIAGLLITVSRKFARTRLFVYAPMLVCALAWTAAIAISQHVGFYAWLLGVPGSAVACIVYWFVVVVRAPKSGG
jgi:hypothetical protein